MMTEGMDGSMGFQESSGTFRVSRLGDLKVNCIVSVDRSLFGPWFYSLWPYDVQLSSKVSYIHNVSVTVLG